MAGMGFRPRGESNPNYVEYVKDYAGSGDSQVIRVGLQFAKGFLGDLSHGRLEAVTVTVQTIFAPIPAELAHAPQICQKDLNHIMASLGGMASPPEAVEYRECYECGKQVSEFVVDEKNARLICLKCFHG